MAQKDPRGVRGVADRVVRTAGDAFAAADVACEGASAAASSTAVRP